MTTPVITSAASSGAFATVDERGATLQPDANRNSSAHLHRDRCRRGEPSLQQMLRELLAPGDTRRLLFLSHLIRVAVY